MRGRATVRLESCSTRTRSAAFYIAAYSVIGNAPIVDQAFTNNRLVGQRMKVEVVNRDYRPRQLTITGNSSDTAGAPAAMNL